MKTTTIVMGMCLVLALCGCTGARGEAGPQGEQGKPGPAGPAGTAGLERAGERIVPITVTSADGAAARLGWWDSDRDEECAWVRMNPSDPNEDAESPMVKTYTRAACLPLDRDQLYGGGYGYYADAECLQPISWGLHSGEGVVLDARLKSLWYWTQDKLAAGQLYEWYKGACDPVNAQCDDTHCYALTSADADFASASGPLAH